MRFRVSGHSFTWYGHGKSHPRKATMPSKCVSALAKTDLQGMGKEINAPAPNKRAHAKIGNYLPRGGPFFLRGIVVVTFSPRQCSREKIAIKRITTCVANAEKKGIFTEIGNSQILSILRHWGQFVSSPKQRRFRNIFLAIVRSVETGCIAHNLPPVEI